MKTIAEKNRLIADFMGVLRYRPTIDFVDINGNSFELEDLQYHTSWDWLMPVVEKIESFEDENRCAKYNFNSVQCFIEIVDNHTSEEIVVVDCDNKFDSTYNAVVQFIEWYNEQNSQS